MSERIEKILARELNEPRSRVKTLLQKGQVTVDGVVARAGQQADPDTQEICLAGEPIACRAFVYLMLNKPTGVLSATDGKVLQPAQLTILSAHPPRAQVVLRQGIYHQVKRMFARVGCTVTALHRTAMGALELDPTLAPGDCRALTPAEVALLAKDTVQ